LISPTLDSLPSRIRITFSISDLDNPPDTSDLAPTADPSGASEEPLMDEDADETSFPVRCSLYITKPSSSGSAGALVMDLLVENETFVIDNISFYKDEKVAEDMTAEGDWKRRGIYIGPRECWQGTQPKNPQRRLT
jgi:complement component 1 Q subcomponent-binding protein